ncbi:hypothetical protein [Poritiphilus flavus]|uniref:Outer membrane protein beta-barrel domain-containing protein n=1 Tax=Poritiphilus flavus TaxID=2697053 RepID=A0A6L9EBG7_9FLAO|nr:hypothetical protein [Poritiphilus flavus]NAS12060.1 hypothetical protein [Poritiphilus flavus]
MRLIHVLVACFLFSFTGLAQQPTETPPQDINSIGAYSFSGLKYPLGVNGERREYYQIQYELSDNLRVQLDAFYNKFGTRNRLRTALLTKVNLSKKWYVFAGPEIEYDMNRELGGDGVRLGLDLGMGYEVNEQLFLEAGFNQNLNGSRVGPYGTMGDSDFFTVRSRFKF